MKYEYNDKAKKALYNGFDKVDSIVKKSLSDKDIKLGKGSLSSD